MLQVWPHTDERSMPADGAQQSRGITGRGTEARETDNRNLDQSRGLPAPRSATVPAVGGRVTSRPGWTPPEADEGLFRDPLGHYALEPNESPLGEGYPTYIREHYPQYERRRPLVRQQAPTPPPPPPPPPASKEPWVLDEITIYGTTKQSPPPPPNEPWVFDPVTIYGRRRQPPPPPNEPWLFDPVTIYGRMKQEPPPPPSKKAERKPWPKYTARALHFTGVSVFEYPPSVEFADNTYVGDIDYVVKILQHYPSFHVTLEASVGITGLKHHFEDVPLGRTKAAYDAYGYVMDARARRVRDELVSRGISADRIHLSRGAAQLGEENRTVDFIFDYK